MTGEVLYLDSSALVKLIVAERHSAPLFAFLLRWDQHAVSSLAVTEVLRAVNRREGSREEMRSRAQTVLSSVALIGTRDALLRTAADLPPPSLRSLDAIHLACALSLGDDLGGLVTYDDRLAEGARWKKVAVYTPA